MKKLLLSPCVVALLAYAAFATASIEVIPANPRPLEAVRIRFPWDGIPAQEPPVVTMSGNKITVTVKYSASLITTGIPPIPDAEVALGRLPAGTYNVEYYREFPANTFLSSTVQFAVIPLTGNRVLPYPFMDYTDLWWNASESGWGISIHVKNDKLFAAWFVYDANGKPTWYTFQAGSWLTPQQYSGLVVKATGPALGGVQGLPGGVAPAQAGTATLTFLTYDTATFSGTVDGQSFTKNIVRQPF